jgi:hypothetical protein
MDARNLRLGLATDGFNPFSEKNTKYSMWPVFVVPYNLPPWACMQESNFMMTLLIPGPSSPGKDFDVFLEPLVEDLLNLWTGVSAYDANTGKMFKLHAAALWCIHDYPALWYKNLWSSILLYFGHSCKEGLLLARHKIW